MTPFVSCKQIVKAYKVSGHEIVALRGIDFEMNEGEMVAIVGPSGAGKSSLLNLLGGIDRPTAGSLHVGERDLLEMKQRQLANYRLRQVGFLWQQISRNLLSHRTALRNVTLPMTMAGMSPFKRKKQAMELLDAVGVAEHAHKHPGALSGGQQQRVALAVALANHPPLLLADEPTGALDRESAEQVMDLIEDLRGRYGLTILMVTHDMEMASHADRILTLRDGALGQDLTGRAEDAPRLDNTGSITLPEGVRTHLADRDRITVEVRPEGILLRPEDDEDDDTHAILQEMLPQDAPPRRRGIISRILRRNGSS